MTLRIELCKFFSFVQIFPDIFYNKVGINIAVIFSLKRRKNMKKFLIISLTITWLFAGFYETDRIRVLVEVAPNESYVDTFNMAKRSLLIKNVSWIPLPTGVNVRYWPDWNVSVALMHNALSFSYGGAVSDEWYYTSIWENQRANGLWILTFTNLGPDTVTFGDWRLRIAFIPTVEIVNPGASGYLRGVFPFMVNTTGTQYARLYLQDVNTGNIWVVMNWTLNPSDPDGTIDWQILQSYDTRGLPDGEYIFVAEVLDNENILKADTVTGIKIDNTSPIVGPYDPLPGEYLTGTVTLSVNASDNFGIEKVQFSVDGDSLKDMVLTGSTYQATLNTALYEEGPHTIIYVARDTAGNTATYNLNVYFDQTAPFANIVSPTGGEYIAGNYTFQVSGSDNLAVDKVYIIFGGVLSSLGTKEAVYNSSTGYYEYVVETSTFSEGSADVYAIIYDKAGLVDTSASVSFYVDNALPNIQPVYPIAGNYITGIQDFKIVATDNSGISEVYYSIDNGSFNSMTNTGGDTFSASINTTLYEEGLHKVTYKAVASTGAWDTVSINVYFDNTSPTISIVAPNDSGYVGGGYTFSASGFDNLDIEKVEFEFSGVLVPVGRVIAQYNSATGYYEYFVNTPDFPDGDGGIKAIIYDKAGLKDSSSLFYYVDNTPPSITIQIMGSKADTIFPDSVYTIKIVSSEPLKELPLISYYPVGFDTIPLQVTGNLPGTEFTAELRVDGSTGDVECRFLYSGKDFAGNIGTNITEGEWFYINALAPILSHSAVTTWEAFDDLVLTVTSHGTKVQKIYLYYKSHFATDYKVKEFMGNNPYTVKIPGSEVTIDGIDYYIEAVSEENAVTRIGSADNPNYVKVIAYLNNGEEYKDGIINIKVPANAFPDGSKIGISRPFDAPQPPDTIELSYTGIFFEIIPPDTQPSVPVLLKITYPEEYVEGMNEDELNLLNTKDYSVMPRKSVSSIDNIYTAEIDSFDSTATTYILAEYYDVKSKDLLPESYVYFAPNPVKNTNTATLFFYLNPVKKLPSQVLIKIYDISGDMVEMKTIKNPKPGLNKFIWNVVPIPRGIYIFKIQADTDVIIKKLAVIK